MWYINGKDIGRKRCHAVALQNEALRGKTNFLRFNPLMGTGNYSAISNNMKLVHLPLMGEVLRLVQQWGDWAGPQPAQALHRCNKRNSPPINGQCTNHRIAV